MKCDKCPKKATVHLTEIVDGKVMEMHLCEDCARDQSQHMEQQFGLADLLAGLTDFGKQVPAVPKAGLQCPVCGLSYEDFRKFGRFGCADCYVAFRPHLKALLKKIHGANLHVGKVMGAVPAAPAAVDPAPSGAGQSGGPNVQMAPSATAGETVDVLRNAMHRAIAEENFERAAELRDRIKRLEQQGEP